MENESPLSSPEPGLTDLDSPQASIRRKSGRVSRKPEFLSQSYSDSNPGAAKRKRDITRDEDEEDDADEDDASESEEISDGEPDEEELREKRRAARKASAKKATSGVKSKTTKSQATHGAKRPRVAGNGIPNQLAIRPAVNGKKTVSRPRKVKPRPSLAAGQNGLYGRWLISFLFRLAHRGLPYLNSGGLWEKPDWRHCCCRMAYPVSEGCQGCDACHDQLYTQVCRDRFGSERCGY